MAKVGRPTNKISLNCTNCDAVFEKKVSKYNEVKHGRHFCCIDCYRNYDKQKSLICAHCKCSFKTNESRDRKYCSRDCFDKSKGYENFGFHKVICIGCGEEFERKVHLSATSEKEFCSNECRLKNQRGPNHPRWIKDRSQIKNPDKCERSTVMIKEWREQVFSRDNWTCQMCNDRSKKKHKVTLNAHHIKKFVKHPELIHNIDNGITLCEPCHKKTYQKEELYEFQFMQIVQLHSRQHNVEHIDQKN